MQDLTAQEVLVRAKLLQWLWAASNALALEATGGWPAALLRLQAHWSGLYVRAARAAELMHRTAGLSNGAGLPTG